MVVCLAGSAHAAPAGEVAAQVCEGQAGAAQQAVKAVFGELRSLHRRALPGPDGTGMRDRQVASLVLEHLATLRFTAEVLRKPWARADEVFRARWQRALGALLHKRFLRALNDPLRYQLSVGEVSVEPGCDEATVHLSLTERERRRVVHLTLRMEHRAGAWGVWDVVSQKVSFVKTWRARFARVARHHEGLEGLDGELGDLARRLNVPWPPLPPRPDPPDTTP